MITTPWRCNCCLYFVSRKRLVLQGIKRCNSSPWSWQEPFFAPSTSVWHPPWPQSCSCKTTQAQTSRAQPKHLSSSPWLPSPVSCSWCTPCRLQGRGLPPPPSSSEPVAEAAGKRRAEEARICRAPTASGYRIGTAAAAAWHVLVQSSPLHVEWSWRSPAGSPTRRGCSPGSGTCGGSWSSCSGVGLQEEKWCTYRGAVHALFSLPVSMALRIRQWKAWGREDGGGICSALKVRWRPHI